MAEQSEDADTTRTHADEFYRESPSDQKVVAAHDEIVSIWEDEHPEWLEDVRPRMLEDPEYCPREFENEREKWFIIAKLAALEAGDAE